MHCSGEELRVSGCVEITAGEEGTRSETASMDDRRVDGRGAWMAFSLEGRMPGSENRVAASGQGAPHQCAGKDAAVPRRVQFEVRSLRGQRGAGAELACEVSLIGLQGPQSVDCK